MDIFINRGGRNTKDPDCNPCIKEANLSSECMRRTDCDTQACADFFLNYNKCKAFWSKIESKRRKYLVKPFMPTQKERILIKREYDKGNVNVFAVPMADESGPDTQ